MMGDVPDTNDQYVALIAVAYSLTVRRAEADLDGDLSNYEKAIKAVIKAYKEATKTG